MSDLAEKDQNYQEVNGGVNPLQSAWQLTQSSALTCISAVSDPGANVDTK